MRNSVVFCLFFIGFTFAGIFERTTNATPQICAELAAGLGPVSGTSKLPSLYDSKKTIFLIEQSEFFRQILNHFNGYMKVKRIAVVNDAVDLYVDVFLNLKENPSSQSVAIQKFSELIDAVYSIMSYQDAVKQPRDFAHYAEGFLNFLKTSPGGKKYLNDLFSLAAQSKVGEEVSRYEYSVLDESRVFQLRKDKKLTTGSEWASTIEEQLPLRSFVRLYFIQLDFMRLRDFAESYSDFLTTILNNVPTEKEAGANLFGLQKANYRFYRALRLFTGALIQEVQNPNRPQGEINALRNLCSSQVLPLLTIAHKTPKFQIYQQYEMDLILKGNSDFIELVGNIGKIMGAKVFLN